MGSARGHPRGGSLQWGVPWDPVVSQVFPIGKKGDIGGFCKLITNSRSSPFPAPTLSVVACDANTPRTSGLAPLAWDGRRRCTVVTEVRRREMGTIPTRRSVA